MKRNKKQLSDVADNEELFRLRQTLRWKLMLFVLAIVIISGLMTAVLGIAALYFLDKLPVVVAMRLNPYFLIAVLLCSCAIISIPLAGFFGRYYLRPVKSLIAATKEVKKGNYKVRIDRDAHAVDQPNEMDILIRNFNEMVHELEGTELLRNDFINNFSHEFKTPIVSIRGFARELQRGDLDEEKRQEYAKIIAEESDRLAKLSISVLELSKLENQQIVTDRTEFYLDEQIRQCILLLEESWSGRDIEMVPELEEVRFFGNEEMLARVWTNLIGNAVKFTPEGGTVTVRLCEHDSHVTVTVKDTGIGMSEKTQSHIFEKFYQGDRSHARSGYGIGLTVVGRVVSLCGGEIAVESREGEGSTFTVTLPKIAR